MAEIKAEEMKAELREVVELGKLLAAEIRKASPYPKEGIRAVVRIVYRELRQSGLEGHQLMEIGNTILQCITEEIKGSKQRVP